MQLNSHKDPLVSTGGRVGQVPLSGRLPLPPAVLHQAIDQAFVDAVDQSFLITGTAVLAIALLVAFLLSQKRGSMPADYEHA